MTPSAVRLPIPVDATALRADLGGLSDADWVPHFNRAYYEGDWSVAALRSTSGRADQIYPDPAATTFVDTPLLARCPGVAALLRELTGPLLAVRFMRLGPGALLKEHSDLNLGVGDGEVRLHAPVTTNDRVSFTLDGQPVDMRPGELWYLDLNHQHAARNDGAAPRVHLVIDCVVDDTLRAMITASTFGADESEPA